MSIAMFESGRPARGPGNTYPSSTLLTAALAGTVAGSTTFGAKIALARSAEPDPVFALIEFERAAHERLDAACRATDEVALGRDATDADEAEYAVADRAQALTLRAVMTTTPATYDGAVAMVDLFLERELLNVPAPIDGLVLNLLANLISFARQA